MSSISPINSDVSWCPHLQKTKESIPFVQITLRNGSIFTVGNNEELSISFSTVKSVLCLKVPNTANHVNVDKGLRKNLKFVCKDCVSKSEKVFYDFLKFGEAVAKAENAEFYVVEPESKKVDEETKSK